VRGGHQVARTWVLPGLKAAQFAAGRTVDLKRCGNRHQISHGDSGGHRVVVEPKVLFWRPRAVDNDLRFFDEIQVSPVKALLRKSRPQSA
jgi:hypothetical protein